MKSGARWIGGAAAAMHQPSDAVGSHQAVAGVAVETAVATVRDVPVYLEGLGNVQTFYTAKISSRVDGQLERVGFAEGQLVKKGDLLAQIDPRTLQAALEQATAMRAKDASQLDSAKRDLDRYVVLTQIQPISVVFTLPEDSITQVTQALSSHEVEVTALSRDNRTQLDSGTLSLVDNQIDASTGTVRPLVVVYIILGMLYESYIHPLTILSTLPSAGVGALLILMLFHFDLSVIALIGIILLMGIVKKNGIMMVDFAIQAEREQHLSPHDAIRQACLLRFRPIMMTTMAALLGALPLMLGHGTGAELRQPLGYTMVGGLPLSQALTLFTTPVIYLYLDQFTGQRRHARRSGHTSDRGQVAAQGAS